jgi:hypothetical protein
MDPRVKMIRENEVIGSGSCSTIDECISDAELVEMMEEHNVTVDDVIEWAYDYEGLQLEAGLNQRWGEDDDVQLKEHRTFIKLTQQKYGKGE